jgi:hypothetical protein
VVFKFSNAPSTYNKCHQKCSPSGKRDGNCHDLAVSCWEMFLKAVGQPLMTAKGVVESRAGKCPKAIGKLEMPQYLPLANRRGGGIAQQLLAKTWHFPSLFSEAPHFCLQLHLKVTGAMEKFFKRSAALLIFCSFQPYYILPNSNWCNSPIKNILRVFS